MSQKMKIVDCTLRMPGERAGTDVPERDCGFDPQSPTATAATSNVKVEKAGKAKSAAADPSLG